MNLPLLKIKVETALVENQPIAFMAEDVVQLIKLLEQLQADVAELKTQALLLRQFLNNSNREVERLVEENRKLKIQLDKTDYSFVEIKK